MVWCNVLFIHNNYWSPVVLMVNGALQCFDMWLANPNDTVDSSMLASHTHTHTCWAPSTADQDLQSFWVISPWMYVTHYRFIIRFLTNLPTKGQSRVCCNFRINSHLLGEHYPVWEFLHTVFGSCSSVTLPVMCLTSLYCINVSNASKFLIGKMMTSLPLSHQPKFWIHVSC